MSVNQSTILKTLRRTAAVSLLAVTAISAFAVLGDGKGKTPKNSRPLLSLRGSHVVTPGSFSLKSGYTFRGNQVIDLNKENKFINLNTMVTYQKGNSTYIIPLKKKIYIHGSKGGFTITR